MQSQRASFAVEIGAWAAILGNAMRHSGVAIAAQIMCASLALAACRDGRDPVPEWLVTNGSDVKRSRAAEMPRVAAESGATDIVFTPRRRVSVAPAVKSFEQMLEDGYIFLADARLREALGPDFDARDREIAGFCVELTRYDGYWMGYASEGCNHRAILFADDSQYLGPTKQGSVWLFESEEVPIRIANDGGALSATFVAPFTRSWSTPVEVLPSESAHHRASRWHRDAEQAFLEQASESEPRLVERRRGQWEYRHRALRGCWLNAWECQQSKVVLACRYGDGEHLLIGRDDGAFAFEHVSGELLREKCRRGPFSGLGPPR